MDVRVGLWRKLSTEELMLLNCGVGEDSYESLELQEDPPVHPKGDQSWVFIGRTDVEAESPVLWPPHAELIHWKRPWCWEELGAGGKGDNRGWDGWMASQTLNGCEFEWTPGSWWWTGRPGAVIHGVTKSQTWLNDWTEYPFYPFMRPLQ